MIFSNETTEMFINHTKKEEQKENLSYFTELLSYLSLGQIITSQEQLGVIYNKYKKHLDHFSSSNHLDMIQIQVNYQLMTNQSPLLSQEFIFGKSAFYSNSNTINVDGIQHIIPFQESFEIQNQEFYPQFKIYPVSTVSTLQDQNLSSSQTSENKYEDQLNLRQEICQYLKRICQNLDQERLDLVNLKRYYLYFLSAKKILSQNEKLEEMRINSEFYHCQQEFYSIWLQESSYSNFLIEFQSLLNSLSGQYSHELNSKIEGENYIMVDIIVKDLKTNKMFAFFFINQSLKRIKLSKQNTQSNEESLLMASDDLIKTNLLKHFFEGRVFPIYYEKWKQTYHTPESKLNFIQNILKVENTNNKDIEKE